MAKLSSILNRNFLFVAFQKPFDISTEEGRVLERRRKIALTAFTSTILKVLNMSIPLITLKITYDYLNVEVFGLWNAITTFFALFAFSDLGLGNGLQTKLSRASGKEDWLLCKKIISNTYLILILVALKLLIVFISSFWWLDWVALMNAKSAETIKLIIPVIFIVVLPKILAIPLSIIHRTQLSLQEGYRSDIWEIIGYLLNLGLIVFIVYQDLGKLTLLTFTSMLPLVVSFLNTFVYFRFQRKGLWGGIKYFDKKLIKDLLSLGISFSFLSILTTLGLSMDTFIVAKTCSLSDAGSYSILFRIATIFSAVISVLAAPLWGANGEAIARGDIKWVAKNTKRMSYLMAGISIVLVIFGLLLAKTILRIWLGDNFEFSYPSLVWLALFQIVLSFISPYFMLLNALGEVRKQIFLFLVYTPLCFVLKFYLVSKFGISVIPFIGLILYILIIVSGIYFISTKKLRNLKFNYG